MQISSDTNCTAHERVSFCFAVYAAVSRDFRSVPSPSFLSESLWFLRFYNQSSVLFKFKGLFVYISTSFIFQVSYPYFRIWSHDSNHRRSRCATSWLPTSPSSGYSAPHLPSSPETGLTLTVKELSILLLVRMTLTRNNHCERGFTPQTTTFRSWRLLHTCDQMSLFLKPSFIINVANTNCKVLVYF